MSDMASICGFLVHRQASIGRIDCFLKDVADHVQQRDKKGMLLWAKPAAEEEFGREWELVLEKSVPASLECILDEDDEDVPRALLGVRLWAEGENARIGVFLRWDTQYYKAAWRDLRHCHAVLGGDVRLIDVTGDRRRFCLDIEEHALESLDMKELAKRIAALAREIDEILSQEYDDDADEDEDEDW